MFANIFIRRQYGLCDLSFPRKRESRKDYLEVDGVLELRIVILRER
jgi:hypothetical protein